MRVENLRILRRLTRLACLAALLGLLGLGASGVGGDSPPQWIDIYSVGSSFDGEPLPVGAIVAVFDPQGVQCGCAEVDTEGHYGIMPCYGDDASTVDDEGAEEGDELTFTVNGLPAVYSVLSLNGSPVPPGTPIIWNGQANLWEVDLQAYSTQTSRYDIDGDCDIDVVDIMTAASRWNCACGDDCYDARADLDDDCEIDILDIMAVASRWNCECGDDCYY